ncbi:hypothetical protein BDZ91DRAFT_154421 [Kalaharituber pfeilii]|nr:hypothetical protein BDZ91DRAFT_154421 [Kalaharituber pfeilii]
MPTEPFAGTGADATGGVPVPPAPGLTAAQMLADVNAGAYVGFGSIPFGFPNNFGYGSGDSGRVGQDRGFEVRYGEVTGIVGESGSGKTLVSSRFWLFQFHSSPTIYVFLSSSPCVGVSTISSLSI